MNPLRAIAAWAKGILSAKDNGIMDRDVMIAMLELKGWRLCTIIFPWGPYSGFLRGHDFAFVRPSSGVHILAYIPNNDKVLPDYPDTYDTEDITLVWEYMFGGKT